MNVEFKDGHYFVTDFNAHIDPSLIDKETLQVDECKNMFVLRTHNSKDYDWTIIPSYVKNDTWDKIIEKIRPKNPQKDLRVKRVLEKLWGD